MYLPDKLGRRWALFIGALICLIGGALQAGSVHVGMFLVARLLTGYGVGKSKSQFAAMETNNTIVLLQDRSEEALEPFKKIHGDKKNDLAGRVIEEEFLLLRSQVAQEAKNYVPLKQFWTQKSLRKRCIIGFVTFFAGQGTATLVINSKLFWPLGWRVY